MLAIPVKLPSIKLKSSYLKLRKIACGGPEITYCYNKTARNYGYQNSLGHSLSAPASRVPYSGKVIFRRVAEVSKMIAELKWDSLQKRRKLCRLKNLFNICSGLQQYEDMLSQINKPNYYLQHDHQYKIA